MKTMPARTIPVPPTPAPDAPKITVEYGHRTSGGRPYRVEFALTSSGKLVSRYLDPTTPWEQRERAIENATLLDAIRQMLEAYAEGGDPHEDETI
jgi:hypothetical protein